VTWLTTGPRRRKGSFAASFEAYYGNGSLPAGGELSTLMASKEGNLEIRTASGAELEQKQRRRLLTALAVLLTALIVVIIRDRQFWFPPSPEPVAVDQAPAPAAPVATPQMVTAPPAAVPLTRTTPSKTRHAHGKHATAAQASSESPAAVPPVVATTSRAVLPPLDIEVVAGNQHRTLTPGNNSVKVDMQSSAPGDTSPATPTQGQEVANAGAQVSMSARTAERVSRTVSPSYPLLAKQMKVQGAVVLQALIDKTGNIQDLHVVSGPAILSAAAQEAVKQWHFKPYYQGGQPVETEARITVNFTISTY